MHICMITSEFPPDIAGISHYVYNLSQKLLNKGHRVTVFTRGTWRGLKREIIDGIIVYRLPFIPLFPFHIRIEAFFLNRFFKNIEDDFDIVHIHHPQPPHINTKIPKIITVHTLKLIEASQIEQMGIKSFLYNIFAKYMFKEEKKVINSSHIITSVSNSIAQEIKYACEIDYDIYNVGNGVDTKYFTPKQNYEILDNKNINILYVGRLGYRKGILDLIKSAEYVTSKYKTVNYLIIGKGQIEKELKDLVNNMGLINNFNFLGFIDKEVLIQHYQNSTLFILPSYYEGLPTTLIEAMACGMPCIATRVDGVPELIQNNENGVLIPKKSPKVIAKEIIRLLEDEELREKIGKNASITIKENFSWDVISNKIIKLYELLIEENISN